MRKATSMMIAILAVFFITHSAKAEFPDQAWGCNIFTITSHSIEVGPDLIEDNWLDVVQWRVLADNQLTNWLPTEQFTWTDDNLQANSWHTYQVQFQDRAGNLSEWSPEVERATRVYSPERYRAVGKQGSITIKLPRFPHDQDGLSGYEFFNMTLERSSGWLTTNVWTDTNLEPNTTYQYALKYKNTEGFETLPLIVEVTTRPVFSWWGYR